MASIQAKLSRLVVEANDALIFDDFIEALRVGLENAKKDWDRGSKQREMLSRLILVIENED